MSIESRLREAGNTLADLPSPGPEALARSGELCARIAGEIEAAGPIPFSRYMALALYSPGLGYYSGGSRKFGVEGDFTTAPEISPLFSQALASQCAEVLEQLGEGEIAEFGAGSGVMAAELLLELERSERLPIRYRIVELSGELRRRQRETLERRAPQLLERVEWLDSLEGVVLRGVVLGNELLDALPVERFRIAPDGVEVLKVGLEGGRFVWHAEPADGALLAAVAALQARLPEPLPVGYHSEIALEFRGWFVALGELLREGVALLIDYGYPRREYYLPQRGEGTLVCHYRHRAHDDPFHLPGLQDITSFVDFTAAAEAALAAGFDLAGYTTQANLLIGCGIDVLMQRIDPADTPRFLAAGQQLKQLMMPGEMGDRFKALALAKGYDAPLCGFSVRDMRERLEVAG